MKKAVCILSILGLVFSFTTAHAQKILHSEKDMITLRFNDYAMAWHLQPELNPDVFTVGSSLGSKKISFITDTDSLSFTINAAEKVDLVIYLKNTPCHVQVSAINDPLFLHPFAGILALVFFVVVLAFMVMRRRLKQMLVLGILSPLLFWIVTITGGWLHGDYHHLKNTISELGRIGTRSEQFMAVFIFLIGVMATIFSIGFFKASRLLKISSLPAISSFSMAISLLWASVFSAGHELHGLLGPLPLLMMLGTLMAAVLWPRRSEYRSLRRISLVSFLVMCLFFFRFIPSVMQNYEGALQRCMYAGWTIWYIAVSLGLRNKLKDER
jgi:hypothetical membrane protein